MNHDKKTLTTLLQDENASDLVESLLFFLNSIDEHIPLAQKKMGDPLSQAIEKCKNIMDKLGILLPCDLPHFRQNQFKPQMNKKNVYNIHQIDKINQIFEKDLSFFGYNYENWLI